MHRRCDRNRKRSQRRAIYCPIHGCYLDSVSQKYRLFADRPGQLQQRGISRQNAMMLVAKNTTVSLVGEWLEEFWCQACQTSKWYHVKKNQNQKSGSQIAIYEVSVASPHMWYQAIGVIDPQGNASVSEFTRRHARRVGYHSRKDFQL